MGLILVAPFLVGCAGDGPAAPDGLFFPTVPREDEYPGGLIRGTLEHDVGCLFVRSGEQRYLLMWPDGYTAQAGSAGSITVYDGNGGRVGGVGDVVELGGGGAGASEVGGQDAADRWFQDLTGQDPPEECRGAYWIVSP